MPGALVHHNLRVDSLYRLLLQAIRHLNICSYYILIWQISSREDLGNWTTGNHLVTGSTASRLSNILQHLMLLQISRILGIAKPISVHYFRIMLWQ